MQGGGGGGGEKDQDRGRRGGGGVAYIRGSHSQSKVCIPQHSCLET